MSDRIAVFNNGRIEQIASPTELYESPATSFVAGFVGTSNLLTGAAAQRIMGRPGTFSVRPEKIRLDGPSPRVSGTVTGVVYLGSVNHYIVDVDGGGTLTVLRQNLHGDSDQLVVEGQRVALSWQEEHVIDLSPPDGDPRGEQRPLGTSQAHSGQST